MEQFLKTIHIDSKQANDKFDKVIIISKDENDKKIQVVEKPKISYYITKPEYWDNKFVGSIELDKVNQYTAYSKYIENSIVENINDPALTNLYMQAKNSDFWEERKRVRDVHLDYRVHGSDINVEDYYIKLFLQKYDYENNFIGLEKSFLDIETDSDNIKGFPDPELAEAPINLITFVDDKSETIYTYCLKYDTDTYRDFENRIDELIDEVIKDNKDHFPNISVKIFEFDTEIELISAVLNNINNQTKPDYCLA